MIYAHTANMYLPYRHLGWLSETNLLLQSSGLCEQKNEWRRRAVSNRGIFSPSWLNPDELNRTAIWFV